MIRQAWLLAGLSILVTYSSAGAQQTVRYAPNVNPTYSTRNAEVEAIARLALARELIDASSREKDALALVVAARIVRQMRPFKGTWPARIGAAKPELYSVPMSDMLKSSAEGILKRARAFANGRPDLLKLIDDVAGMAPASGDGDVYLDSGAKDSVVTYEFAHEKAKRLAFYVESSAEDGSLALIIKDNDGNFICEDQRLGRGAYCEWTPRQGGVFRAIVINPKKSDQDYVIVMN